MLQIAHTADLPPGTLRAARALLDDVFAPEMTEEDWEHCLGGMHALVWEGDTLLAHAAVIQRRLLNAGRALRTGYVEGVAVRADARGRGHGAAVMGALERIIGAAYDVGALGSTDEAVGFYESRGWRQWQGSLATLTPEGARPTPDEAGGIYVLPTPSVPLDLTTTLTCGPRPGDPW